MNLQGIFPALQRQGPPQRQIYTQSTTNTNFSSWMLLIIQRAPSQHDLLDSYNLIPHGSILRIIYSLLLVDPPALTRARPLLRQTFLPSTLVSNRISSQPSLTSPVFQTEVTSLSPGRTGLANLA